jgi:hypothetical protein
MSDAHVMVLKTNQIQAMAYKHLYCKVKNRPHISPPKETHRRGQIHSLTSHLKIYPVKPVGQVLYSYGRLC